MTLTLEVTGTHADALGVDRRKVFDEVGGTIGRSLNNAWTLPDPYVSSRHALIHYRDGTFFIEDTSTNGIYINSSATPLGRSQPYALKSGDTIFVDPYEISVSIANDLTEPVASPFDDPLSPTPATPLRSLSVPEEFATPVEDPPKHDRRPVPTKPYPSPDPPIGEDVGSLQELDLPGWQPAKRRGASPVPLPAASTPPVAGGSPDRPENDLAAVLAAAGLGDAPVTPELVRSLGEMLRVVVRGVMDILQARQKSKSEFRMAVTTFKPAENNPLKFSANVEDALHNLLVKRNPAYLGPVDAFEDAFNDLRNHQMAMLAGVRVAFEAMLAEFDPDRLQEEFDRQLKKGALLSVPAKLRYWELYRHRLRDMAVDPEHTFRELFGEEFAEAYEEHLRRLEALGRADKG